MSVHLSATAHTAQSVEHARAKEADESNDDKLSSRRGVPAQADGANLVLLVLPARRAGGRGGAISGREVSFDLVKRFFVFVRHACKELDNCEL